MNVISSTEFRKDIAKYIREAKANVEPLIVTTQKQGSVVVIPLEEWAALQETQYLLKSPKHKARLEKAVKEISEGKFSEYKLD